MTSTAEALIESLARRGVRLSRRGDRLHVEAPRGAVTAALRETLLARKPELLVALTAGEASAPRRAVLHFRLRGHSPNAWATALGRPGEPLERLLAELGTRFGDRLLETRA